MRKRLMACLAGAAIMTACSGDQDGATAVKTEEAPEALKQVVITGGAPAAVGVGMAKKSVKNGESVAVEGRIKDFVEGQAALTLVDGSVPACSDIPGDACETPWDYCCEPQESLAANTATVKLVDADGRTFPNNLKGVESLDNLTSVVVEGKATVDAAGNLTVAASKLYLKK